MTARIIGISNPASRTIFTSTELFSANHCGDREQGRRYTSTFLTLLGKQVATASPVK